MKDDTIYICEIKYEKQTRMIVPNNDPVQSISNDKHTLTKLSSWEYILFCFIRIKLKLILTIISNICIYYNDDFTCHEYTSISPSESPR